jgi:multiple sugar transport system substrate-binding protein
LYHDIHSEIAIVWKKRTLKEFGETRVDRLASEYDLVIVDHPFMELVAHANCFIPLDTILPRDFLLSQAKESVGPSFHVYTYGGHQWALAIDAAAQISAYRPDLMSELPADWDMVLQVARRSLDKEQPKVALPLSPADCFCTFLTLCANRGEPAFTHSGPVVSRSSAIDVLSFLGKLAKVVHPDSFDLNPPKTLERMSETDEISYVPILFGYSNYARPGYRSHVVRFGPLPSSGYGPIGSTLGGAGIAISSTCRHVLEAADYVMWITKPEVQRTTYFDAGGQPGNRVAWLDVQVNKESNNFFLDTWESMLTAYVRPRYFGFTQSQAEGGAIISAFLREQGRPRSVLHKLDKLFLGTRKRKRASPS